jgi:hypothetical protein
VRSLAKDHPQTPEPTPRPSSSEPRESSAPADLSDLLEETRILLPGAELLTGFLVTLPFTDRFDRLDGAEKQVYLFTFFASLLALACLLTPSVYHRLARPIHDKRAFKDFSNRFIVIGLVPFTLSLTLAAYLIASIAAPAEYAVGLAVAVGVTLATLWWIVPYARLHDAMKERR